MKAKEKDKAKELIDKYYRLFNVKLENTISMYEAARCALVAVDEILNCPSMNDHEQVKYEDGSYARSYYEIPNRYWTNVKNEILKEVSNDDY